ncbi:hypothetical protein HPB50_000951 [Hyalomma asiaticum]|uniref:Uncharacterized protein n=1 Tax=Hyalomma asiaticum TaxID=266040 RepID=A0ACB7T4H1_HYAAI|nr:hypothetical protein HPB50_000951 [Hyalomma asiaticum]
MATTRLRRGLHGLVLKPWNFDAWQLEFCAHGKRAPFQASRTPLPQAGREDGRRCVARPLNTAKRGRKGCSASRRVRASAWTSVETKAASAASPRRLCHHPEAPGDRRSQGCIPTWRAGSCVRGLPGHSGRRIAQLPPHMEAKPVAGTRDPHVADKFLRDFQLDSSKGRLPMHGHLKLTGDVCRGVINVANHETSESLQNKIQWRAGQLADIRKLGNSNVSALSFVGKVVLRFVHYNSEVTLVRAYGRTIPACVRCGTVGHRTDICPIPDNDKCGLCGLTVPTTEGVKAPHECIPSCVVCGQAHSTNSRDCKGKFRQLKVSGPKAKRLKPPTTRLPNESPSHPTSGANGGAPRGAHTADAKTPSPPAPSRQGHPPLPGPQDTWRWLPPGFSAPTWQTESKLASALSPQNSDAMESDAKPLPALVCNHLCD